MLQNNKDGSDTVCCQYATYSQGFFHKKRQKSMLMLDAIAAPFFFINSEKGA